MCMSQFKEIVDIILVLSSSAAFIFGIFWSYFILVKKRQIYPRASIVHNITHKYIKNDELLLHVGVTISNLGNVLLSLISLETRIQKVFPSKDLEAIKKGQSLLPEGETEVPWLMIASDKLDLESIQCEVEPSESQDFHHYFKLDAKIETIEVYTTLINKRKRDREINWDLTTLYELNETEEVSSHKRKGKNNA